MSGRRDAALGTGFSSILAQLTADGRKGGAPSQWPVTATPAGALAAGTDPSWWFGRMTHVGAPSSSFQQLWSEPKEWAASCEREPLGVFDSLQSIV